MMQETHRIDQTALQAWLNQTDFTLFVNTPSVNEALPHFKSGTAILLHNRTHFVLQPTVQNIIPYRAQAFKFCASSVTYQLLTSICRRGSQVINVRNVTKCLSHFRTTVH